MSNFDNLNEVIKLTYKADFIRAINDDPSAIKQCLITLREVSYIGWVLFGIVWGLAILGIVFNAINMHHPVIKTLSMVCYLGMGWCVIFALDTLLSNLAAGGFVFLLLGGISYTIGAIFYGFGKKCKYIHSVWHLFVVLGSILQFFSVLFYVIIR